MRQFSVSWQLIPGTVVLDCSNTHHWVFDLRLSTNQYTTGKSRPGPILSNFTICFFLRQNPIRSYLSAIRLILMDGSWILVHCLISTSRFIKLPYSFCLYNQSETYICSLRYENTVNNMNVMK